mgnify:CR=1 FL=1
MRLWLVKYRKAIGVAAAILLVLLFVGLYTLGTKSQKETEVSPTPTPTLKPTAKPTLKPTATPTPKPTATPTPTPTPTPIVFSVTGVTAAVSPTSYTGSCPKKFDFTANITTNAAGTVTYKWARSDGAGAPTHTLVFASAGTQPATPDDWTLSSSGTKWEKIQILTPNSLESNQAEFTLNCL